MFVRLIDGALPAGVSARVQFGLDGIHRVDEGTELQLPTAPEQTTLARVSHFGGRLRLVGALPDGVALPVIVHPVLKE